MVANFYVTYTAFRLGVRYTALLPYFTSLTNLYAITIQIYKQENKAQEALGNLLKVTGCSVLKLRFESKDTPLKNSIFCFTFLVCWTFFVVLH
jgi:hypothetical protein